MKKESDTKTSGRGGTRSHAGRPKRKGPPQYETVAAHVPVETANLLKFSAEKEGISLSAKAASVLTTWADAQNKNPWDEEPQPDPSPDALAAAVNRLAEALEKIVERVSIDKE